MAGLGVWFRGLLNTKENADSGASPAHVRPRTSERSSFDEDNNDFALATYGQLRQEPGNIFLSPFSIRIALAMTLAGARGETAAQMREALRISSSDEMLHVAIAKTIQQLNDAGAGTYEMAVANSLWGQSGDPFQPEFLDLIARHYGGGMNLVDFRRGAETARRTINRWVEDKTKQRIQELIPSGGVNGFTRLVLANAVYFKGMWASPFDKEATHHAPFYVDGGGQVEASLMHQTKEVRYLQAKGYQAVDIAYRGGDLSMLVLLPDRQDGLRDLEDQLTERALRDFTAQMETRKAKLFLPRFKITWGTTDVSSQLTALGMPLAFRPLEADFSGMNGHEPPHVDSLFISAVFHKAFVEVNEKGTEAAAATAVAMTYGARSSPPPKIPLFRADHPFLFAIRDRRSGTIVFFGRISDPTQEH